MWVAVANVKTQKGKKRQITESSSFILILILIQTSSYPHPHPHPILILILIKARSLRSLTCSLNLLLFFMTMLW